MIDYYSEKMKKGGNIAKVVIVIFIVSLLWGLFFTHGFSFFWEDFACYRLDKELYPLSQQKTDFGIELRNICFGFLKNAFSFQRLLQINFDATSIDRPYMPLTYDILRLFFGDTVIMYRIFQAITFALCTYFIFLIVSKISFLLAVFSAALYISSFYEWLSVLYLNDLGIQAQLAVLVAIWLFLKLTDKAALTWRTTTIYYFLIFIFSNYAILAKSVGGYIAIMFFLTVFLFHRKALRFHLLPLFILLALEIPLLGFFKKFFVNPEFNPINLASHNTLSFSESLKSVFLNRQFAFDAMGRALILWLFIAVIIHITSLLFRKSELKYSSSGYPKYKERTFLFMLWTIFSLIMIAVARSFRYDGPLSFQLIDFQFLIGPFIVFLFYYTALVYNKLPNIFRRPYFLACCGFILFQLIAINLPLLNRARGGWGNYFCAWKNAEKYIEKNYDNALALSVNAMDYKPFIFSNSNNKVLNTLPPDEHAPFCDLKYIENKFKEGYENIFVLGWGKLKFRGESKNVILLETRVFDGDSGDLYDRLKCLIRRPSKPEVYVYHFKLKGR